MLKKIILAGALGLTGVVGANISGLDLPIASAAEEKSFDSLSGKVTKITDQNFVMELTYVGKSNKLKFGDSVTIQSVNSNIKIGDRVSVKMVESELAKESLESIVGYTIVINSDGVITGEITKVTDQGFEVNPDPLKSIDVDKIIVQSNVKVKIGDTVELLGTTFGYHMKGFPRSMENPKVTIIKENKN
ncbi:hypothetical protein [Bacillus cereus]|uniref:hypothetical protein n=1 Tax=Bacillus cereus group TaxID=86661 RepID=UPI000279DF40|nr:hypothetical protein [Bacillus cereus]EJR80301.1 hypothetical protein IKA_05650 [Bacillus cereus VD169]